MHGARSAVRERPIPVIRRGPVVRPGQEGVVLVYFQVAFPVGEEMDTEDNRTVKKASMQGVRYPMLLLCINDLSRVTLTRVSIETG